MQVTDAELQVQRDESTMSHHLEMQGVEHTAQVGLVTRHTQTCNITSQVYNTFIPGLVSSF